MKTDAGTAATYSLDRARSRTEIEELQRLRYAVFLSDRGAETASNNDAPAALDADRFDAYCEHLLVRCVANGAAVGTYRLLPPDRARAIGGLYSETEFDLEAMRDVLPRAVEVGRACVHPDHRNGGQVIGLLWAGLQDYLTAGGFDHVIGCASVDARQPQQAAALTRTLLGRYLGGARAEPRLPFDYWRYPQSLRAPIPSLLKSYLRLGAVVCGPPAYDPAFETVDFLIHLPLRESSWAHAERIMRRRRAA